MIDLTEDGAHERFANQAATVADTVFLAKAIERTLFLLVEQNTHPMFARLLASHQKYKANLTPAVTRLRPDL